MAAVNRILTSIRPHVPLIRFPSRSPHKGETSPSATSSKAIGKASRGSGIDFKDLPLIYRRKPIAQDEMEYIEKGGQV